MGNKHSKKRLIPTKATKKKGSRFINFELQEQLNQQAKNEAAKKNNENNVVLNLSLIQYTYQCFSDWSKIEMNEFWAFNKRLHETTWQNIYASAGKKNKSGLAYTKIGKDKYPDGALRSKLSQDITLFELRVSKKIRVHGFRLKNIFFLCWLDKNHDITE